MKRKKQEKKKLAEKENSEKYSKKESKFSRLKSRLVDWADTPLKKAAIIGALFGVIFFIGYLIVNFAFLFNFLIGYDTIVRLSSSEQGLNLVNGETETIEFSMYVSTKAFCESECTYKFTDLSSSEVIDNGTFSKQITNPFKKSYDIVAPFEGEGQRLYGFELVCVTEKKGLCKADESEQKRNKLIPLNYELSSEQERMRNESKENIEKAVEEYNQVKVSENKLMFIFSELNKSLNLEFESLPEFSYIEKELESEVTNWENYRYDIKTQEDILEELGNISEYLNERSLELNNTLDEFNNFVGELWEVRDKLIVLKNSSGYSLEDFNLINQKIIQYNSLILETNNKFSLNESKFSLENISFNLDNFDQGNLSNSNSFNEVLTTNLSRIRINKNFESNFSLTFDKENPTCCYLGNCGDCCDESCREDPLKYPVLLIHGHSFNEKVSSEKSLGDMVKIQGALEADGFLNGGQITVDNEKAGMLIQTNQQIVFVGSYYFDIYENNEEKIILQTKSDDINTYAIRLNDLVNTIKEETGRDKVVLVSHSMGGLVSRRYLQIYGDESISELIMIGTPNNGIDGTILRSCPVFGAESNCQDMDKDSLLMNKLTYGPKPEIPVQTIIGQGCKTDGEESDGIVKVKSAYMDWADNYYVNGTCSGVNFFHITMRDPEKYLEVYEKVRELILDNVHS